MKFDQVLGQETIKAQLLETVRNQRLPHAQLFLGPKGSGKLALAFAFATYLLCENKGTNDACGQCPACIKADKLIHPDLHFSYPTVGSKAISTHYIEPWRKAFSENPYLNANQWLDQIEAANKQGNITKEECMDIIRKLSFKTFEGTHKILILWLPEYLTKEGNRLLKLIEEPPEDTVFILVAEDQEKILNTILSRCQIVKINQLSDEDIMLGLQTRFDEVSREQAEQIAYLSNGDFNEAQILLQDAVNDHATRFLQWFRIAFKGEASAMVDWVDGAAKIGREKQKQFLTYALHFLREILFLKTTGSPKARLRPQELATAQKMKQVINLDQLDQMMSLFNDCHYAVERNGNPKVIFLHASIKVFRIFKPLVRV